MEIAGNRPSAQRWVLIALIALLGLAITAAASNAGASGHGQAVAAKKHCKKKGKKSAAVAKKKCKKKRTAPTPGPAPALAPVTPPAPGPKPPVVRADVTWTVTGVTDEADIDVHAWSSSAHTGYSEVTSTDDHEIPNLVYEPGFELGRERILDKTNPSTRGLTFAICSYDYADADPAEVTYHFVFANGTVLNGVENMSPGEVKAIDPKEGGFITDPEAEWCP
jgi:hypothetical protein